MQLSTTINDEESESIPDDKKEDFTLNYGCLHIDWGLLLRNAQDAVTKGDCGHLIRTWTLLTCIFRLKGHNKYALARLHLIASVEGLLTPCQAHRLNWNRLTGREEGKGNIKRRNVGIWLCEYK